MNATTQAKLLGRALAVIENLVETAQPAESIRAKIALEHAQQLLADYELATKPQLTYPTADKIVE